jgi:hypothetical protein
MKKLKIIILFLRSLQCATIEAKSVERSPHNLRVMCSDSGHVIPKTLIQAVNSVTQSPSARHLEVIVTGFSDKTIRTEIPWIRVTEYSLLKAISNSG